MIVPLILRSTTTPRPWRTAVALVWLALGAFPARAQNPAATNRAANADNPPLHWFDARAFTLEGRGWTNTPTAYDRLPARAQGVVRDPVWQLSRDSAGLALRFVSDATAFSARWTVRRDRLALPHMAASGASGVDLYVRYHDDWRWLGAARPDTSRTTEKRMTTGLAPGRRECLLYLPLYNGVEQLEIGVPEGAYCEPAPPRRPAARRPIVFYGTSIVQGGCASRPGMAYPAILGRRCDWSFLNLGFSGNAQCEPEIGALLAELDPVVYVLDPLPNMTKENVALRVPPLLDQLRAAHPKTPIILVENVEAGDAPVNPGRRAGYSVANANLHHLFETRVRAGDHRLYYVYGDKLLGEDGQGTVDRIHPTDLGFMRLADGLEPVLRRALRAAR